MGSTNKIKGYGHSAPGLSAAATICAVVPFIVLRVVRRGGVGEVCIEQLNERYSQHSFPQQTAPRISPIRSTCAIAYGSTAPRV